MSLHIIVKKEDLISALPERFKKDIKVLKAIEIAEIAHSDTKRENGTTYLENHIWYIGSQIIKNYSNDRNFKTLLIVGLLHDCIEDSDKFTLLDIEKIFGKRIASLVKKLTKDSERERENPKLKYVYFKKYFTGIKPSKLALIVKFEDRLANLRTINKEYVLERKSKTLFNLMTTEKILLPIAKERNFKINYVQAFFKELKRIKDLLLLRSS